MKDIIRQHSYSISFIVVLFLVVFVYDRGDSEIQQLNGFTMGTSYQFQIADFPENIDREVLAEDIGVLLDKLDRGTFSTYAQDSELSRFNQHSVGTPFTASARMIEVLSLAREISELSDGAFDVTVGPLVNLWGFGPLITVEDSAPEQDAIDEALSRVDFRSLHIDAAKFEISKSRDVYVDLSAIAKGYAVDEVARHFDSIGIDNYFLEIGGELKIKGFKPGDESWVPAIETPLDTESQIFQVFFSRGDSIAVAGSGDYRNYFEEDGVRYSHEIDPRNGMPIRHRLAASYVIDASAARADALATVFMVLGLEESVTFAEKMNQAVYLIYKDDEGDNNGFSAYVSDQFAQYLNDSESEQ